MRRGMMNFVGSIFPKCIFSGFIKLEENDLAKVYFENDFLYVRNLFTYFEQN